MFREETFKIIYYGMPQKRHILIKSDKVTDWSGQIYSKLVLRLIQPGFIVRIMIENTMESGNWEKVYMQVTKVKDGSLWGTIQDTYRMADCIGLPNGSDFSCRVDDVIEIPLTWQPKSIHRELRRLLINNSYSNQLFNL